MTNQQQEICTTNLYCIYTEQIGTCSFDSNAHQFVALIQRLPNETPKEQMRRAYKVVDNWTKKQKKWPVHGTKKTVWDCGVIIRDYRQMKHTQELSLIKDFPKLPELSPSQYPVWED